VHGSVFEFLRNTALDARNYFSQDRAAYRQNQFGGAVGGSPFHRSVTLFGDYQGTRLTEGIDTAKSPCLAGERGGDFIDPTPEKPAKRLRQRSYLASLLGASVAAATPIPAIHRLHRQPPGGLRR